MAHPLGVDFGTSNTAAGVVVDGKPTRISLEGAAETFPTTVFLDFAEREMVFGQRAIDALIEGREGRFMRALKRVLGTPLVREPRQLLNSRMTLLELVARFLANVKQAAEDQTGLHFDSVLSGRPVRFHVDDPARDQAAERDLAECYRMAGFDQVEFLFEPEAAAWASGARPEPGRAGLVVDIGGGTSDFTVFEQGENAIRILGSHGERIGGTDFDKAISIAHVMPLLGLGTQLRAAFGPKTHTAPVALFHDLATWEKIAFMYSADTRRAAAEMAKYAVQAERFARLTEVLEMELGHDLAFATERAKIAANTGDAFIDLSVVAKGLDVPLSQQALAADLLRFATAIGQGALQTLAVSGHKPNDIADVVFVGGSSLMQIVQDELRRCFPDARMIQGSAFSGVVDGLALAAAARG